VIEDQAARSKYAVLLNQYDNWEQARDEWIATTKCDPDDLFGDKRRCQMVKRILHEENSQSWSDLWLLTQHFDFDRKFQQKVLNSIEGGLGKDSDEYRYLADRISCGLSGSQLYGTQEICGMD
jgi:hypothetical protein